MKLLAIEARQYLAYSRSRYEQIEGLGVELYVLNGEGTPDFWPEERYRRVGTNDIDTMIEHARAWHAEEHFEGVLSFSESAVIAVAAIASGLGLPSIGVETAKRSRNKLLMRQAHEKAGAPIPRYRFVPTVADALAAGEDFGYPVILKPTLGAASNFVFRIDSPQEMEQRFEQANAGIDQMAWAANEAAGTDLGPAGLMVESFLDGREYLMEALAWDDEVYLGSVVDRITTEGATFDDDVHHAPTSMSADDLKKVHAAVIAAAHGQGLWRSVMHAEVRFHKGEPYLLEIAARPGGGGLDMIARITADYDPIAAVIDVARGVKPRVHHYAPTGVHTTSMCLLSGEGVVDHVDIPAEVSDSKQAFLLKITARPGDVVKRPPNGNTILGFLGTTGTSMEDAFDTMNDFASKITVKFVE